MDSDQKDFLTHLRNTHFLLVVLCLVAVFAISQVAIDKATKAANQLSGIIAATAESQQRLLLTSDEATNMVGLARYKVNKTNEFESGNISARDILKDVDQIYLLFPRQKLQSDYWGCKDPFAPSIEPSPYNPHLVHFDESVSLAKFIQIWNDLGQVVLLDAKALPDQLEMQPRSSGNTVTGIRQYGATYLSDVPILLTCLDAGKIGLFLTAGDVEQNSSQGWDAVVHTNIRAVKYNGDILPTRVNWRARLAKGIDYLPQSANPASFKESFPELEELTQVSQSETLNANVKMLQIAAKINPPSLGLFGLSIPLYTVGTWSALAILVMQMYFFINTAAYCDRYPEIIEEGAFPWIPVFRSRLSCLTSWITIIIMPAAVVLYLVFITLGKNGILQAGLLSVVAFSVVLSVCTARTRLFRMPSSKNALSTLPNLLTSGLGMPWLSTLLAHSRRFPRNDGL